MLAIDFQNSQLPGDKFETNLPPREPSLSGGGLNLNESSSDPNLQLEDRIELEERKDRRNPTTPRPNHGTADRKNGTTNIPQNSGKNTTQLKPNSAGNSLPMFPRLNDTLHIVPGSDVPDKNFIEWVFNPFTTTTTTETPVESEECAKCR